MMLTVWFSANSLQLGVTNNTDYGILTYTDNDADGFGSTTLAACGVTNNASAS
jgi:hypothetical protein